MQQFFILLWFINACWNVLFIIIIVDKLACKENEGNFLYDLCCVTKLDIQNAVYRTFRHRSQMLRYLCSWSICFMFNTVESLMKDQPVDQQKVGWKSGIVCSNGFIHMEMWRVVFNRSGLKWLGWFLVKGSYTWVVMAFSFLGRMFNHSSLPALFFSFKSFFFFFSFCLKVEISLSTLIPLFWPVSVHSGWMSWDDCGQVLPGKLLVTNFRIGSHTTPEQRHSWPTLTSSGQGCMCV